MAMKDKFVSCHDGFNVGDRVVTEDGEVGILESIDPDRSYCDVRLMTPDNVPSILTTGTRYATLRDGHGVVPMPRSPEWHREAREFTGFIHEVARDIV